MPCRVAMAYTTAMGIARAVHPETAHTATLDVPPCGEKVKDWDYPSSIEAKTNPVHQSFTEQLLKRPLALWPAACG